MTTTALTDTVDRVLPEDMARRLRAVEADAGEVDRQARQIIQERPLLALAMAVAGGYLLARLLRSS